VTQNGDMSKNVTNSLNHLMDKYDEQCFIFWHRQNTKSLNIACYPSTPSSTCMYSFERE